ncbi:putative nicotinate-nucleotide pyrophosphorylase (carboxylating) [Candidatus Sulfobium mesophilum]|uniref:Probable nicotinate-nucleotide pyrophosphorylase [carboxylating] n=1 Tax=Candidatus Sulfobium mesophilum TaxID=2016548 RepID=A0A2U3QII5_9BACT|nr:putative nicotinate-nucleotide pyrophosphorylase (carboxylating) [Candidatus Sulfobium mesophilum]
MDIPSHVIELIKYAIEEDVGHGDITTNLLVPETNESKALYIAKGNFVLAGMPFAEEVFSILDSSVSFKIFYNDGARVSKGDVLAEVVGKTRVLLAGERISLNILQRLCGIATLTSQYVDTVRGTRAKILDTRKTTPCHRFMEKYAVRVGGGTNHRFGLYDGILIKDNHIEEVGSIGEAVRSAKFGHHLARIEVEVENLKELQEAIEAGADIVMLDNMSTRDMAEAVAYASGRVTIEASGNISLENVREVAETGVDLISVGALTHSAVAADISMKIVK